MYYTCLKLSKAHVCLEVMSSFTLICMHTGRIPLTGSFFQYGAFLYSSSFSILPDEGLKVVIKVSTSDGHCAGFFVCFPSGNDNVIKVTL